MRDYHIKILCADQDSAYTADLPRCADFGDTPEAMLKETQEAKDARPGAADASHPAIPEFSYQPGLHQSE